MSSQRRSVRPARPRHGRRSTPSTTPGAWPRMYARRLSSPAKTGSDSRGNPASTHARQRALSRWSERSERYADRRRVNRSRREEPVACKQHASAVELGAEGLGREVALVDLPARAVVEHALLDALRLDVVAQDRVDDDELRRHPPRLGEEPCALLWPQVAVEMRGEDAVEGAVRKRKRLERVRRDRGRRRQATFEFAQHRRALVEAHHHAGEMTTEKAGPARDVERRRRRERLERTGQRADLLRPTRPRSCPELPAAVVPLVVLGRTLLVVRLHAPRVRRWSRRSNRFRTSPRDVTRGRSRRWARLSAPARGCSTFTPTTTTTARSSPSWGTRRRWPRRSSRRSRAPSSASTSVATRARIRAWARPTSFPSSLCGRRSWNVRARSHSASRSGSATSSGFRSSCTARWAPDAARPSSGAAVSRRCSAGSTRAR